MFKNWELDLIAKVEGDIVIVSFADHDVIGRGDDHEKSA
jgi:hypothetical protein